MREMTALDDFWDIKAQEAAEEHGIVQRIDGLQRAIGLGRRASALKVAAGYADFLKAVHDLHAHAVVA